jgi:hypothetical protein
MKLSIAVSIIGTLCVSTQATSLRGLNNDINGPFDELKCTLEARADEEKCHESKDVAGNPCDYCVISSNGEEAGICVSSEIASQMEQINPEIACENTSWSAGESEPVELSSDFPMLECTLSAFTDESKCAQVENDCQYCQFDIDGQETETGLCVGPDVASKMSEVSNDISCTTPSLEINVDGPFDTLKCTIEARADEEKCHESKDVDGNPCDYCTISSNGQEAGICVSSDVASQMEQINPEITCEETNTSTKVDEVFVDSFAACMKVGLSGGDSKTCRDTIDDGTGENCVFCSSPNLDDIGLCMSSSFRGKHGRYYTCDASEKEIFMSME